MDLKVPGLKVKRKLPGIGTAKLNKNICTVEPIFDTNSLEITVIIKKDIENKFRYTIKKLPGEIVPDKCTIEFKDDLIILKLHKAEPSSWEIQLKKGLEQAKD